MKLDTRNWKFGNCHHRSDQRLALKEETLNFKFQVSSFTVADVPVTPFNKNLQASADAWRFLAIHCL
jgi:hypothetical protein